MSLRGRQGGLIRVNVSSQLTERWLIKGETDHLK